MANIEVPQKNIPAAPSPVGVSVALHDLTKRFGKSTAVDQVSLAIAPGELFFLLGPSGCGKTTLLRMIAGFTDPDSGTIHLGERDVTRVSANRRRTGMVFQGYALWPHMSVQQNVAFGLDVLKVEKNAKRQRVEAALRRVQMLEYAQRKPNELSGGQQQRVALARALVIEPTVLLLDEPLSNLDAKLRLHMRSEIRAICKEAGITAIYVTHDQKEALSMADRIAVMREGKVVQMGPPRELYQRPTRRFVADFLGDTNFVAAQVLGRQADGSVLLDSPLGRLCSTVFPPDLPETGNVTCSIRPEAVRFTPEPTPPEAPTPVLSRESSSGEGPGLSPQTPVNSFTAQRVGMTYLGEMAQHELRINDELALHALELNPQRWSTNADSTEVRCWISPDDVVILGD